MYLAVFHLRVSCLITTEFAAHEGRTWSLQKLRLTKKGWNACNLYTYSVSFWPIYHRRSTDIPPKSMVSVSGKCWLLYWPRYLPIVDRYVDHHSAHILVVTSVDMSTDTSQLTYRPTLDRYVDRHIGRHSADMSTDALVECRSMCRLRCRPIYLSRGAQNTHDPRKVGPARRVTLPSQKDDPARRVTLLAKPTFCFSYKRFAKFCKEMYEKLARPG